MKEDGRLRAAVGCEGSGPCCDRARGRLNCPTDNVGETRGKGVNGRLSGLRPSWLSTSVAEDERSSDGCVA
jgi:hypothetical protein